MTFARDGAFGAFLMPPDRVFTPRAFPFPDTVVPSDRRHVNPRVATLFRGEKLGVECRGFIATNREKQS